MTDMNKIGYCNGSYHGEPVDHDVPTGHQATTDCDDWQSLNEIKNHKASCTDNNCECKR